jgi:hypothetical protein
VKSPRHLWTCSLTSRPSGEIKCRLTSPVSAGGARALVYSAYLGEKSEERNQALIRARGQGLTSGARRLVRDGCAILERLYGRKAVFGTFTLPGSTSQAVQALAKWSSKIVELFRKWIEYHAPQAKFVWVWEYQKRGALHLHVAIGAPDYEGLRYLERNWRQYSATVVRTLSRLSGVDCFQREQGGSWRGKVRVLRSNCRPVRKSVARYMSKYMSKSSAENGFSPPSRWSGMSRLVRVAIACTIRRCTGCGANADLLEMGWLRVKQYAERQGFTVFTFSQKYSTYARSCLIYPTAGLKEDPYEVLKRLLQGELEFDMSLA